MGCGGALGVVALWVDPWGLVWNRKGLFLWRAEVGSLPRS